MLTGRLLDYGRDIMYLFLPCVDVINFFVFFDHLPSLAPNMFFYFSKELRSSFYSFTTVICPQWHREDGNLFLGYVQPNWFFYAGFVYKCPLLSYTFKNLFISYFLSPCCLLHSPPASHFEALKVLPLQCPWYPDLRTI